MTEPVNIELEPWVLTALGWCRKISRDIVQNMTVPGDYRCILPPVMSPEELLRIKNIALSPAKEQRDIANKYLELIRMDSIQDALIATRKTKAEQRQCRLREIEMKKEIDNTLKKIKGGYESRHDRFLAKKAERERAELDRFLRYNQELQRKGIKHQRERIAGLTKTTAQLRCQPSMSELRQFNERLTETRTITPAEKYLPKI